MSAPETPPTAEQTLDAEGLQPQAQPQPSDPFSNGYGFTPGLPGPATPAPDALWLVFSRDSLLLQDATFALPDGPPAGTEHAQYLGMQHLGVQHLGGEQLDGRSGTADREVWTARLTADAPDGLKFSRLRGLYGRVPDWLWVLGGYAYQIVEWDRTHTYCGNCATPTVRGDTERVRRCPNCGLSVYPRLAPAVMVLLTREHEGRPQVLLCRSPQFPPGMYSANAGFVEPGETVEHAAHREMKEETNLSIRDLRYFDSQPWPFPHSLMLAYTARYAGGEIIPQPGEIEEARWFDHDALPALPDRASISRRLIESVVGPQPD
ncbi:NAD(+) diphosphatase [Deinococcus aquiradiocola]|uniref:NAD(+) diphosphatase n=1 Tax=Deinococcus aquiradiocola TaxID=393059 RepID=A0A917US38_9DEIO|nr:NAD(+) diphosphatase [Deinococcus aquiradiocola]GGJ80894.1 NADH pyrophosphatase [Deinococcus aquiradiocola]